MSWDKLGAQSARQVMLDVAHRHAYNEMTMSSSPPARRAPLGTSRGSKLPARSRGTASGTGPTWVASVLGVLPLREFGEPRPAGSP